MQLSSNRTPPGLLTFDEAERDPGAAAPRRRLVLTPGQVSQLRFLCEASYPFEACGLLVGISTDRRSQVTALVQARNLELQGARERYLLDPEDFLAVEKQARGRNEGVLGIWHSHPDHPAVPSAVDCAEAWHGYSYVIVAVDPLGDTVMESWRLDGARFVREEISVN